MPCGVVSPADQETRVVYRTGVERTAAQIAVVASYWSVLLAELIVSPAPDFIVDPEYAAVMTSDPYLPRFVQGRLTLTMVFLSAPPAGNESALFDTAGMVGARIE